MLRLRIFASVVSILSLATMLLAILVAAPIGVAIALLVAAACLAIVAPFDARDSARRLRVLVAGLAYLVAVAVALLFTRGGSTEPTLLIALTVLLQLGVGIACWAFATRKRRRMPQSRRYFDN